MRRVDLISRAPPTRRETLKHLGLGFGMAGLAPASALSAPHDTAPPVDVIVIGAGFAGMIAARTLLRAGKSVRILEARDRVGGRVKAGKIAGQSVDVGGMWVAPGHAKLRALADGFGMKLVPQYISGKNVEQLPNRRWLADGENLDLEAPAQKEFDAVFAKLDKLSAGIRLDAPWLSPQAEKFDRITVADWIAANTRHESARAMLHADIRDIWSAEPFQMSFLYFLFYIRSSQTMEMLFSIKDAAQGFRVREGLHGVATALGADLGPAITLNMPVRMMSQDADGIVARTDAMDWPAKFAVMAVPLPLSVRIAYAPPLPAERDALAQQMPMGSVIKWYAAYDTPFWRGRGLSGYSNSGVPPISATFDVSPGDGSSGEGGPGFLVGFIDSRSALQWTGRTVAERKQLVTDHLVQIFGPAAGSPIDYEDQNWPAEEWSRGCYGASMGPGVMTTVGSAIRAPHGRIHWAGSETAVNWMGYVEGAISSGERAGQEILARL